jgi:hypothetical protein
MVSATVDIAGPPSWVSNPRYLWNPDGNILKNYTISTSSATQAGVSNDDLVSPWLYYFWVSTTATAPDPDADPLRVTIDHINGGSYSVSTTFNVREPKVENESVVTDPVILGPTNQQGTNWVLQAGRQFPFGFNYTATLQEPQGATGGQWCFLQLVQAHDSVKVWDGNLVKSYGHQFNGSTLLDNAFPMLTVLNAANQPVAGGLLTPGASYTLVDSPNSPLDVNYSLHDLTRSGGFENMGDQPIDEATREDSFDAFIMYKPSNDSRWVPVKHVTWNWQGHAKRQAGPPPWTLVSSRDPAAAPPADAQAEPVWTGVLNQGALEWYEYREGE